MNVARSAVSSKALCDCSVVLSYPDYFLQDAFYPLLIFQFLEECWQQDYSRRPSAAGLNKTLSSLTGISVQDGKVTGGGKKILMDSYVLHHSYRHSVSTSVCSEGSFTVCAALISPEESSTSLVVMEYQDEEFATGVEMQVGAWALEAY